MFGIENVLASLLQAGYIFFYVRRFPAAQQPAELVVAILFGLVSTNLLVCLLSRSLRRHPRLRAASFAVFLLVIDLLLAYHARQGTPLQPFLLTENLSGSFTPQGIAVAFDRVSAAGLIVGATAVIAYLFLFRHVLPAERHRGGNGLAQFGVVAAYGAMVFLGPSGGFDEVGNLAVSALRTPILAGPLDSDPVGAAPLAKWDESFAPRPGPRPNIVVVMVESFDAGFVEGKAPGGKEYTPFFNALIRRGIFVDRYYSNSIQTCRAQFALLCSTIPSTHRKEFRTYRPDAFRSLPAILRNNGYRTAFFQAYYDLDYDSTGDFMSRAGFDLVGAFPDAAPPPDGSRACAWGGRDDSFYLRFADWYDRDVAQLPGPTRFVLLAPIGNHWPFEVPEEDRRIFRDPRSLAEHYANSVRVADDSLRTLFERVSRDPAFANTIFLVTGDHGFPLGEHGYFWNESSFYEEFFRVPLLIVGPGIAPSRIDSTAFSHMDLAPTIADLTGVDARRNQFSGVSMMRAKSTQHPIQLVQPYAGVFVSTVIFPLKYTVHLASGKDYLRDLLADPSEAHNLSDDAAYADRKRTLQAAMQEVFRSQERLDRDLGH